MVIVIICRTKKLHSSTNIFVASLAVNDLIFSGFFIVMWITTTRIRWSSVTLAKLMSTIMYCLCSGTTNQSIMHMAAIAIDRYIHIAHPFYYMKHAAKHRVYIIVTILWIAGIALTTIPPVIFTPKLECVNLISHQPAAYYFPGASVYVITVPLVCFCYSKIACLAFRHKLAANARRARTDELLTDIQQRNNRQAALRSVQFVALMFGVFTACTLPQFVSTGMSFLITIPEKIYLGFFLFAPIHSVINFLIFATMNREFSSALMEALLKYNCLNVRNENRAQRTS
ncbi:unnamed protein product [Candidula unifasciata]|uniref:G-protein coupled receptors family 1 profile domain-containing protein n=1 Tax=Candidula unifasciata TaxID=100452 RepID=A0A8S3YWB6_9EUPU|nr:unnamed protein product [Candidula unifasciata]